MMYMPKYIMAGQGHSEGRGGREGVRWLHMHMHSCSVSGWEEAVQHPPSPPCRTWERCSIPPSPFPPLSHL